jgi:uncharacterized C2H2 Zn-finger protein
MVRPQLVVEESRVALAAREPLLGQVRLVKEVKDVSAYDRHWQDYVKCPECGRVFDLLDPKDSDELAHGHDCEGGDNDADGVSV